MHQQQFSTINKPIYKYLAPQGAPQAIAKQLHVTNDVVCYHNDGKYRHGAKLIEKEPTRQQQQKENYLQIDKKDLDKEPLGQRVTCVAW